MKSTLMMVLLLGVFCVIMAQKYPQKFDNVNIETVLSNDRVLTNYIKCLLDKGACTREGRELKSKRRSSFFSFSSPRTFMRIFWIYCFRLVTHLTLPFFDSFIFNWSRLCTSHSHLLPPAPLALFCLRTKALVHTALTPCPYE